MIDDCFIVYDEIDMVRLHVSEWADVPDVVHVAIEGTHDFRGRPKPCVLRDSGIADELPRLCVFQVAPDPTDPATRINNPEMYPWIRESDQRNSIATVLTENFRPQPDDLILVTDADEIIRSALLPQILDVTATEGPYHLRVRQHCYSEHYVGAANGDWYNYFPIAFRWKDKWEPDGSINSGINAMRSEWHIEGLPEAGWHLSWFGGADRMFLKVATYSHTEQEDDVRAHGVNRMENGEYPIQGTKLDPWDGSDMPKGFYA